MRGPGRIPVLISVRHPSISLRRLPVSRTLVTPFASKIGKALSVAQLRCTCMSHKPGMANFPRASTSLASAGALNAELSSTPCNPVALDDDGHIGEQSTFDGIHDRQVNECDRLGVPWRLGNHRKPCQEIDDYAKTQASQPSASA